MRHNYRIRDPKKYGYNALNGYVAISETGLVRSSNDPQWTKEAAVG
jgi:hypothetical protein